MQQQFLIYAATPKFYAATPPKYAAASVKLCSIQEIKPPFYVVTVVLNLFSHFFNPICGIFFHGLILASVNFIGRYDLFFDLMMLFIIMVHFFKCYFL